jgi:transcriptional regulator with XRE-family HTH domain
MAVNMALFGERLFVARRRLGVSQTQLAAQTGLDLGNLNELEHGRKTGLRAETLLVLAVALEVSADYLLGLTDDPYPVHRGRHPLLAPDPLPPRSLMHRLLTTP